MKAFCHFVFFLFSISAFAQNGLLNINGLVTDEKRPIANVNVLIKGTSNGVLTDITGRFSLKAQANDIVVFSYLGMQTVEISVDDDTSDLNVALLPRIEELTEVVVKKKMPFTPKELLIAYPTNKNLIKTSRGILDKDRASFSIRIIDGKNLIPVGTDFLYSLQNLYLQMEVIRDCPPLAPKCPYVILQNWSSGATPSAIFDVDGFIYEQAPTFLSAHDIDRVAILVRNGAISRYGPQGAGGVIIINTKSKAWMDDIAIKRTYDNSALRDSIYKEIRQVESYKPFIPDYINELNGAELKHTAEAILEKQKTQFEDSPYYYLDVAEYFQHRWEDKKKAEALLEVVGNTFSTNIDALKALAYSYEERGSFDMALKTYLKILTLDSRAAQSHRNVANAYNELGNYRKALANYTRYVYAINELDTIPFDARGTDILMSTESSNIIKLNRKQLAVDNSKIEAVITTPNTRLVFEWNNALAEFELQFESPDGATFSWKKTKHETDLVLQNQVQKGYASKQFFLDDTLDAGWNVIINYLGNQSDNPTYLKVTSFFDYGKPSQHHEFKIYKLNQNSSFFSLFSVNANLILW